MRGAWTVGAARCAIAFVLDDSRGGLVGEAMLGAVRWKAALVLLKDDA